jgi:hypothetical protein
MRSVAVWLVCSASALSGGCVILDAVDGSGKITTESRPVAGFSEVSLSGIGQAVIEQTGTESLTVTTDDNLLPYVRTEVRGSTLELALKDGMTSLRPSSGIVFHVTAKTLEHLRVSGSGEADVKSLVTSRLQAEISGSGDVKAQGMADDLVLRISGSGSYQGADLKTRRADVRISGSGDGVVNATDTLDVNVSGSGSIEYSGNPRVSEHVSGSGSIRQVR